MESDTSLTKSGGGAIQTAKKTMKINRKYSKNVNEAMNSCRETIISNIVAMLKDCYKADDRIEVALKNPVFYHETQKCRNRVNYTPQIAEKIGASGLNGDRRQMIIVVEGNDTFCPLEWMPITTLYRIFESLLETIKAE